MNQMNTNRLPTTLTTHDGDRLSFLSTADKGLLRYVSEGGVEFDLTPDLVVKQFVFPHAAPSHLVRQGKYECAAAALASVTGESLFQVKRMMGREGWRNDDSGADDRVMRGAARRLGFDLIGGGKKLLRALGKEVPTACITVRSLNYPKYGHAVGWKDGQIIDPNFGHESRKFWSADWAPWTMGAYGVQVLAKRRLEKLEERDINHLIKECPDFIVKHEILKLAV